MFNVIQFILRRSDRKPQEYLEVEGQTFAVVGLVIGGLLMILHLTSCEALNGYSND